MVEERHDIILGSAVAEAGRARMAAWRRTLADASRVRASGTYRAAGARAGARRRPRTFIRKRPRRTGQRRSGRAFDSGAGSRSVGSRHPELVPVGAPRNVRPADQNRVSAEAGLRPRDVPAGRERREQRPAARRDRAESG